MLVSFDPIRRVLSMIYKRLFICQTKELKMVRQKGRYSREHFILNMGSKMILSLLFLILTPNTIFKHKIHPKLKLFCQKLFLYTNFLKLFLIFRQPIIWMFTVFWMLLAKQLQTWLKERRQKKFVEHSILRMILLQKRRNKFVEKMLGVKIRKGRRNKGRKGNYKRRGFF